MTRRSAYLRRRRQENALAAAGAVLLAVFVLGLIALSIWIHFFASCGHIGWLPAKEMPSRCYTFVRQ
jgi:hypothetical protein